MFLAHGNIVDLVLVFQNTGQHGRIPGNAAFDHKGHGIGQIVIHQIVDLFAQRGKVVGGRVGVCLVRKAFVLLQTSVQVAVQPLSAHLQLVQPQIRLTRRGHFQLFLQQALVVAVAALKDLPVGFAHALQKIHGLAAAKLQFACIDGKIVVGADILAAIGAAGAFRAEIETLRQLRCSQAVLQAHPPDGAFHHLVRNDLVGVEAGLVGVHAKRRLGVIEGDAGGGAVRTFEIVNQPEQTAQGQQAEKQTVFIDPDMAQRLFDLFFDVIHGILPFCSGLCALRRLLSRCQ